MVFSSPSSFQWHREIFCWPFKERGRRLHRGARPVEEYFARERRISRWVRAVTCLGHVHRRAFRQTNGTRRVSGTIATFTNATTVLARLCSQSRPGYRDCWSQHWDTDKPCLWNISLLTYLVLSNEQTHRSSTAVGFWRRKSPGKALCEVTSLSTKNADFAEVVVRWRSTYGFTHNPAWGRGPVALLRATTGTHDNRLSPSFPNRDSFCSPRILQ